MRKVFLIKNIQHELLEEQKKLLEELLYHYESGIVEGDPYQDVRVADGEIEVIDVPAEGWNIDEMRHYAEQLHYRASGATVTDMGRGRKHVEFPADSPGNVIVFLSPIPFLIKELSKGIWRSDFGKLYDVFVFHNDRREKKELPDGRIIQTVAKTGWQLV